MRLNGKVALITGASSGIGRAIALRFGQEGAKVVVNYLGGPDGDPKAASRKADADAVVAQIVGAGGQAVAVPGDVSRREPVEALVAQAVAAFGRLDIAVNNAGIEIKRPFLEVTDAEWDAVIGVNLKGTFLVTQAAARQMNAQPARDGVELRGSIVTISSTHEDISFPGYTAYCASKGGVRMLTRNLSVELAPMKININNIAPGAIATPINQAVLDDPQAVKNTISEVPWGRFGTPDEVAGLAVYLASDEAAYASGGTFYLDGGLSQQVTLY